MEPEGKEPLSDLKLYDTRNESFMRLYEPHHASALAYAQRLSGNEDDARDLLQEALEAALRGLKRKGPGELPHPSGTRICLKRVLQKTGRNRHPGCPPGGALRPTLPRL